MILGDAMQISAKILERMPRRFWKKVTIGNPVDCWLWNGNKKSSGMGYGVFRIGRRWEYAHRVAFFLAHGRWPEPGKVVMHLCDHPLCVNPAHLREGTQLDNVQDAQRKGRTTIGERNPAKRPEVRAKLQGEGNGSAKLTTSRVLEIRQRAKSGVNLGVLAREYGVSRALVCRIANGKRWSHL